MTTYLFEPEDEGKLQCPSLYYKQCRTIAGGGARLEVFWLVFIVFLKLILVLAFYI